MNSHVNAFNQRRILLIFNDLNLIAPIQKALESEGYRQPTPIQAKAIPHLLAGNDLLGTAQTGTGKTAAFAIPILQGLSQEEDVKGRRQIRALVIAPTRELALQIGESFRIYGSHLNLRTLVVYGGVSQHPQTKSLAKGIDILVATPGRLLDLINQKYISLKQIRYFVLDEADMMLEMGMIDDVRRIIAYLPSVRQTMCFSATMPKPVAKLANSILNKPVKVDIIPNLSPIDIIEQKIYFVDRVNKMQLLVRILRDDSVESVLVFSRTKHGADRIVRLLVNEGFSAQAIHGDKTQYARQKALSNFKKRKTRILVATDIAARGLDISELSHVINFDLPDAAETYVHRIGRTGRAGLGGIALSFCDHGEKSLFRSIQKLIDRTIPEAEENPFPLKDTTVRAKTKRRTPRRSKSKSKPRSKESFVTASKPKKKANQPVKARREKQESFGKKKKRKR